jgi:hypothetical protein
MSIVVSRSVYFSKDGGKGEKGAIPRGPQAWSDCPIGYPFQAGGDGDVFLDYILYNSNPYLCKKDHIKALDNYPGSAKDQSEGYWELGDMPSLIATKLLLSSYALIKNLGAEAIEMKDKNGNVIFEAKDGNVTCKTGTFENVKVSGSIYRPPVVINDNNYQTYAPKNDAGVHVLDLSKSGLNVQIELSDSKISIAFPHTADYLGAECTITNLCGGVNPLIYSDDVWWGSGDAPYDIHYASQGAFKCILHNGGYFWIPISQVNNSDY